MKEFTVLLTLAVVCTLPVTCGTTRADDAGIPLDDLIERIEANERLFSNIDIALNETYELLGTPISPGGGFRPYVNSSEQVRYVQQSDKYRVDVAKQYVEAGDRKGTKSKVHAFDGNTTRIRSGKRANVRDGSYLSSDTVRPHMLLFSGADYTFPLSTYLSGSDAIRSLDGTNWPSTRTIDAEVLGVGVIDGRPCQRIRTVHRKRAGATPTVIWELWIDTSRNCLPVKLLSFSPRFSDKLPASKSEVLSMREIKPGMWIPSVVETIAYDPMALQRAGEQRPQWRNKLAIDSIDIDPHHPAEYFANIEMPDGTVVHKVTSGGLIYKSETIGKGAK